MRKKQTPAEDVMWELLRDRRFMNLKFRRQHQIGDYVADFFCNDHKLVIELDGKGHRESRQAKKDKTRDAYLKSVDMTVLRVQNEEFFDSTERTLQQIANACHPPSPPGRGPGGECPGARFYVDIPGFCRSATLDDIRKHGHVLTPGRYVGAEAAEEDGEPFDEKMKRLAATLREQQTTATKLDTAIAANLKELGYGG